MVAKRGFAVYVLKSFRILSEARLDGKDYAGILEWLGDFKRLYPPIG